MKLVFLYGPAASGKLTVARELAELTGLPVFHNHLIVDAVASVFPFGSDRFVRLREQFWLVMLREASEAGRSTIFTFAPEPSVIPGFPERVRDTVIAGGGTACFIRLTVAPDEQERRIADPGRAAFGKLRSLDLLRRSRADSMACEAAMPEAALTIDTGLVSPPAAARMIATTLDLPG
jgi:hypothetical protein